MLNNVPKPRKWARHPPRPWGPRVREWGLGPGGLTFGAYAPGCATVYLEALLCRWCSVPSARARMYMDRRALASSGFKGLGFRASPCAGLSNNPSAHPAPSEPRGCCPRSQSWAFFNTPTRCETSQATTQITSC